METHLLGVLVKLSGAAMGSILSLSVLRPRNVADAFFRFIAGFIGGFVAGPLLKSRFSPEVAGAAGIEVMLAYTAGAAFLAYFTLSAISGTISKWGTVKDIMNTYKEIKERKDD